MGCARTLDFSFLCLVKQKIQTLFDYFLDVLPSGFVCGRSSCLKNIGTAMGSLYTKWWWEHVTLSQPWLVAFTTYHLPITLLSGPTLSDIFQLDIYLPSLFLFLIFSWVDLFFTTSIISETLSAHSFHLFNDSTPKFFFFFSSKYLQFASSFTTVIIQWFLVYRDLCASITIHAHGFILAYR